MLRRSWLTMLLSSSVYPGLRVRDWALVSEFTHVATAVYTRPKVCEVIEHEVERFRIGIKGMSLVFSSENLHREPAPFTRDTAYWLWNRRFRKMRIIVCGV